MGKFGYLVRVRGAFWEFIWDCKVYEIQVCDWGVVVKPVKEDKIWKFDTLKEALWWFGNR